MTKLASKPGNRAALVTMYVGAGLTVLAAASPFIDRATTTVLADHIRAGYPTYGPGEIDTAVNLYTVVLSTMGVLGLLGWLGTVWAVRVGRGWARLLATGMFAIGAGVAIVAATTKDTSGDVGLAPQLGLLQILPCLAGLAAVVLLWRKAE
ncbi:hypothetical protein [Micromonospora eburnea]|uniref:DUF998 domain-containing protein n=1 Tax=Micromonospora eburnea TaxID=227316 RepID=A0A1C6UVX4_9ACTN|nr:hypothetical protein [Micromonospora eburnea]SCL58187.1 hypothetical protein GA0070604_3775 [Micromonospora eburnea]